MSHSPYVDLDRGAWAKLGESAPLPLSAAELDGLRSLGDPVDLDEVREVYLPLIRLLTLHIEESERLYGAYRTFLLPGTEPPQRTPFVIGIAGSVSVGKSTIARLLRWLLSLLPHGPRVELITTDGFLRPNAELEQFVRAVKAGAVEVAAPVYSHLVYDVLPDEQKVVRRPDILLLEGLNVLQPAGRAAVAVSDFIDFSVYVDAATADIRHWYVERFLRLRETAFRDPESYFRRYAALNEQEAVAQAESIWAQINEPNLERNIRPTLGRASLVLRKGADHNVTGIRLRKV
jgi:type I pantothenate kinase